VLRQEDTLGLALTEPSYGRMINGKILAMSGALATGQAGTHRALLVSCKLRLAALDALEGRPLVLDRGDCGQTKSSSRSVR